MRTIDSCIVLSLSIFSAVAHYVTAIISIQTLMRVCLGYFEINADRPFLCKCQNWILASSFSKVALEQNIVYIFNTEQIKSLIFGIGMAGGSKLLTHIGSLVLERC